DGEYKGAVGQAGALDGIAARRIVESQLGAGERMRLIPEEQPARDGGRDVGGGLVDEHLENILQRRRAGVAARQECGGARKLRRVFREGRSNVRLDLGVDGRELRLGQVYRPNGWLQSRPRDGLACGEIEVERDR